MNEAKPPAGRRRRRWLRRLLVVLVLLLLLVAALPYIAASGPVVRLGTALVNDRINGRLDVDELSLGWFAPARVRGVRLTDRAGRMVLRAERIALAGGVWHALIDTGNFRRLDVVGPRVELHELPEGGFSLIDALRLRRPAEEDREPIDLPELTGTVFLQKASVLIVRADGRRYEVPQIDTEVRLNTLGELSGSTAVQLAPKGRLSAEFRVTGLSAKGEIDPHRIAGTLALRTIEEIDLKPLGDFALAAAAVAGTLTVSAEASLKNGDVQASYDLKAASLTAAQGGKTQVTPLAAHLHGEVVVAGSDVSGTYALAGEFGRLQGRLRYLIGQQLPPLRPADVLAAVLNGSKLAMPDFSLETTGQVDLPKLAKAVPALLRIRPDVAVDAGVVSVRDVAVRGGQHPEAQGEIALNGLVARRQEQEIHWQPVAVQFDAAIRAGEGLGIRRAHVESDFLRLDANGTPGGYRATYESDLAKLGSQLGEVFDLGDLALGGQVRGTLTVAIPAKDRMDVTLREDLRNLACRRGGRSLAVESGSLSAQAAIAVKGEDLEVSLSRAELTADDELVVVASGRLDTKTGLLDAVLDVPRAALAGLADKARALGAKDLPALAGEAGGKVSVRREATGSPLISVGALAVRGLTVDKQPVGQQDIVLEWSGVNVGPDANAVTVAVAKITGGPATVQLTEVDVRLGKALRLAGDVDVSADLGRCAAVANQFIKDPNGKLPVELAGRLSGRASARPGAAAGATTSAGLFRIRGLTVDKQPVGQQDIVLEWSGLDVGPDANAAKVALAKLTSDLASVQVAEVDVRLGKALRLAGDANVSADLGRCAALANQFIKDPNGKLPAELAGRPMWAGKAASKANGVTVSGSGRVVGFVTGSGPEAVRVEPLTFDQTVRIDPDRELIQLERLRVDSDLLALNASGTVSRYRTTRVLDISGHYKGDWQRLMAVARQLAPGAKELALTGPLESDFRLTGPASDPKLQPEFRDMAARTAVGWASADYAGFSLGQALLPVELAGGQVAVPVTEIDASGGKVRLGGTVDLRGREPQLRIPGRTVVVEGVRVNKEMGRKLLSRFNPIFGQLVSLSGTLTLTTQDLDLPLGEGIKKSGSGGGRLDLSGMQVQPGGLLAALLALGGIGEDQTHVMDVSSVDFRVHDGGVRYDDFTVTFGKTFDLKFFGTVRFDDALDMVVSVPVRSALLRRFGVKGAVDEYARLLEGSRIELPILGTRLEPKLDLSKVDVRPLIQKAAEALLKEKAGSLLGDLLKPTPPPQGPTPAPPPAPPTPPAPAPQTQPGPRQGPATRPAEKKPEELLLETVFDLLDGLTTPRKNK